MSEYAFGHEKSTHDFSEPTHARADVAAPPKLHIDLRGDNELPALLAEKEALAQQAKLIEARQKANRKRIEEKLGSAATASLHGWLLRRKTVHRKGYWVEASTYSYVVASRRAFDFG